LRSAWRAELRGAGARRPLARAHPRSSEQQRVYSCSYFRLQDDTGRPLGVCEAAVEITERYEAQTRLALLSRASGIGTTLDVRRPMEEFAGLMVPDFADSVRIEVAESVPGRRGSRAPGSSRTGRTAAHGGAHQERPARHAG
jgi:hypothetical protein